MTFISRARWGRIAAAAATVAATAFAPTAAHAEPAGYTLSIRSAGVSEGGKTLGMHLDRPGREPFVLDDTRLVIDTAGVAEFATAWVPNYVDGKVVPAPYCSTAGTVTTCELGRRWSNLVLLPHLHVQARKGAEIGRSGKVTVTLTAKGVGPIVASPTITVAEDSDLAVAITTRVLEAKPGERIAAPVEVTNTSDRPVKGAVLRLLAFDELELVGRYTNCFYRPAANDEVHCGFDRELAPHTTYVLSDPWLGAQADADDTDLQGYLAQLWTADDAAEQGGPAKLAGGETVQGTSGVLRLEPKPVAERQRALSTDSNGRNNLAIAAVRLILPAKPSPSPSVAPTAGPAAGASPSPAASPGGGTGGGLPVTGAGASTIAGVGAGLLGVGLVGFLVTRRRRTRFVA